uniref:Uncharacterized protein n=1 Tax=Arundo donax TaxID=35708 RepID=A0A0A9AIK1_ARUDO
MWRWRADDHMCLSHPEGQRDGQLLLTVEVTWLRKHQRNGQVDDCDSKGQRGDGSVLGYCVEGITVELEMH